MKKILLNLPFDLYEDVKRAAAEKGLRIAPYIRMVLIEKVRG